MNRAARDFLTRYQLSTYGYLNGIGAGVRAGRPQPHAFLSLHRNRNRFGCAAGSETSIEVDHEPSFDAGDRLSDQSTRLSQLVDAEGARLYALLTRLTLRHDVADDLLQELVVRLNQSEGFQHADNALAYARRTAIHLAFDWRRQGKRRRQTEPLREEPAVPAPDVLGKLVAQEELERVLATLEKLSRTSRTCLVLHYMEQLSYAEVADQLQMTPHQVRAACHKSIRRLRKLLGAEPSGPAAKEDCDEKP